MTEEQIRYLFETINELRRERDFMQHEMEVMKQQIHENNLLATISCPVLSQEQRQSAYTEYMQIQQQKEASSELARAFK